MDFLVGTNYASSASLKLPTTPFIIRTISLSAKMSVLCTKDTKPFYRSCVHPQEVCFKTRLKSCRSTDVHRQVAPPMQPAPPLKHETVELEGGKVLFEKDIAITMRDGATLYADLYHPTPALADKTPTLIHFAPFGKHGAVPREKFQNMDVDFGKLSKYTKWELPDPLRWCGEFGFSLLSIDPRGTWWSEGEANHLSPEEGRDGYDIVEWAAEQSWYGIFGLPRISPCSD